MPNFPQMLRMESTFAENTENLGAVLGENYLTSSYLSSVGTVIGFVLHSSNVILCSVGRLIEEKVVFDIFQ